MKKKTRVAKPSKYDMQAAFTVRNHKDLSTYEITTRLTAHYGVMQDTEKTITALRATLAANLARLNQDRATADGLECVLISRQ